MSIPTEVLARAAAARGIEPQYTDIWGRLHETPEHVTSALLAAVGVPVSDAAALSASLDESDLAQWSRPFDETLVVREDVRQLTIRIPDDRAGRSVKLEIEWETGELEHHWFWLPEVAQTGETTVAGLKFLSKALPLPELRLGYHRIRLWWVEDPQLVMAGQAHFIVCPRRAVAFEGRTAGVALSLYGLRSQRNWGCGDFTDLLAAIDAFGAAGADFIALNPLHAIANRQPYNTSPYLPQCTLYRNFIYLDVEQVGHFDPDAAMAAEIAALREAEFVEYERVAQVKLTALRTLFAEFERAGESAEFDAYIAAEGTCLRDYAIYCALDESIHAAHPDIWLWTDWPEEFRDPRGEAVERFAAEHADAVRFFEFLQWQIDRQLARAQAHALSTGMRIGLYHDLALATDRFGSDLWAQRPFYVDGARVGSPPDDFSPSGQDWAFPPPNREVHRADGYQLFAQSIRNNARHGGALRIDHVMRFFRLYWIPPNTPATEGAYVRDYASDLIGVLALESVRGKFVVIGEDLGTVTGEVRHSLSETGILSYRLLWFEREGDGRFRMPHEYPSHAATSTTTHDLPTLGGFDTGRDIEARRASGLIDDAEFAEQSAARARDRERLHEALAQAGFAENPLGFLLSTPCAIVIINQEDLTGETMQQNLPGSTWQYPNWRRKMKVPVEELASITGPLAGLIEQSSRR